MKKVFNDITVRIFTPRNTDSLVRHIHAGPFRLHSEENVRKLVAEIVQNLKARHPDDVFEAVKVGPAKYNFVWKGYA